MLRAFGMKVVGIAWCYACLRFLPAPLGAVCAALGGLFVVLFLVQAVCNPASQFLVRVVHRAADEATPRLALTFDDGPDLQYTPQVLDALRQALG